MIQVDTENSSYEIDMANKRIRRLNGSLPATPRFARDDQWRPYMAVSSMLSAKPWPVPGESLLIAWEPVQDLRDNTITSLVKRVITIPDDPC